ncbi:MAG: HIRAN domain-containing protein [Pseudomonadota bacterium]
MITNIKASLVGMKYYGVTLEKAARALEEQPGLRRDPYNIHDSNAIAVYSGGMVLGHIDRKAAAIIAPLLDDGAGSQISIDTSRARLPGSIPVAVKIDRPIQKSVAPLVCEVGVVGIYRIFIKRYERCYIGQSINVQNRLEEHWDELSRGIHTNPELRRAWQAEGAAVFGAEVLEKAPRGLSGLALARWLVERERAWVTSFGGLRSTFNVKEPRIVLDDEARAALSRERLSYADELATLERTSAALSQGIYERRDRADDARRWIKDASGFWGWFASAEIKRHAELANRELPALQEKIRTLEENARKVNEKLHALKRHLFLA